METNKWLEFKRQHPVIARAFSPLATVVRAMERGRIDLLASERVADRFFAAMEAVVSRMPGALIRHGVVGLLHDDQFWRPDNRRTISAKGRAYCDYFEALNADWPYASTILTMGSHFLRRGGFVDVLRGIGHLQRASMARRERRAEWLRSSTVPIIESLFYESVSLVYAAECLRQRRPMTARRGGPQLREVAGWTARSLPGLFRGDEGRIRNAAVHHDRWRYVHESNAVRMTDEGWSQETSTQELLVTMRTLLEDSYLPFLVMARLHGPESRLMLQAMLTDHPAIPSSVIEADFNRTITELRSLGWRSKNENWAN